MSEIKLDQSDNLSGISSVEFIPFIYVTSIPSLTDGAIIESAIMLKQGYSFSEIELQRNTGQEETNKVETDGGDIFKYSLKLRFPKETKTTTKLINELCAIPLILKVTDMNGIKKIIGSNDNRVKCTYTIVKNSNVSGFNGYQFTFTYESTELPAYLE